MVVGNGLRVRWWFLLIFLAFSLLSVQGVERGGLTRLGSGPLSTPVPRGPWRNDQVWRDNLVSMAVQLVRVLPIDVEKGKLTVLLPDELLQ
jgi:hypothetical protein